MKWSYALWQKTQALEATLSDALDGLAAMQESLDAIAEASETFGIWSRLAQEGGRLGFLRQPRARHNARQPFCLPR